MRTAGWQALLVGGLALIAAYYLVLTLGTSWAGAQVALYTSANGTVALCAALAARRHPAMAGLALLVAASAIASIFGDVTFYFLALIDGEVDYPSVADAGYLCSYFFLALALLLAVRRRTPGSDLASGIDAAVVAVSVGYLIFEFVIVPTVVVSSRNIATLVSVAYPVGDIMLITAGARLVLGAGSRTASLRLIGGYLALVLVADTIYSVQILNGTYRPGNFLDVLWMTASFLLAAAMLHPGAPHLVTRSAAAAPEATTGRLAVLAVAAVLAPTIMIVQFLRGVTPHIVLAGVVCIVLFLLVLARMGGLVRAQRHTAITDGLTGLRSRRFFEQALHAETARAIRSGREVSVLLLDLDHFKTVNDTYGHNGGDRVLVALAQRLTAVIRPGDLVARYGGEEFAVLLPGADLEAATLIAERIRLAVAVAPIPVGRDRSHRVTVSVGVAGLPAAGTDADELVLAADQALYAAKDAGRDRVVLAGVAGSPAVSFVEK